MVFPGQLQFARSSMSFLLQVFKKSRGLGQDSGDEVWYVKTMAGTMHGIRRRFRFMRSSSRWHPASQQGRPPKECQD